MSIQILDDIGHILVVEITGTLHDDELSKAQENVAAILGRRGGGSILLLTENFEGWDKEGEWDSLAFQQQADALIRKIAIVGEKRWEEMAMLFVGDGYRPFPVRYFPSGSVREGQAWLEDET